MKTVAKLFVGCAVLIVSCFTLAQSTPSQALLVLSKGDLTLSAVDPGSGKVLWHVPSGPDPHEVAASPDGRFAYISNYGFGAYHTITPVDLNAQKALTPIDLGPLTGPHGLDFIGGKLWFTAEGAKVFGSYDPATQKIDFVLGTGQDRTHMIRVSDDQQRIVTTNVSSATVTIAEKTAAGRGGAPGGQGGGAGRGNAPGQGRPGGAPAAGRGPQANWTETVIPVGRGSEGFDITPDWREAWVANAQDGTISIIDLTSKRVVQTLQSNTQSANRLKITPDGKLAFVSMLNSPEVAVFDVPGRKEVKRIQVGKGAAGIQMQPDGTRVFVACTPDNYVVVIDVKSLQVTNKINAGAQPDGLWWIGK